MSIAALAIVGFVAVGALGLAVFQTWYFPKKTQEMVDLFMVREAKAMERIRGKAKEALKESRKTEEKKAPDAMPAGSGNRRFRTWPT